MAFEKKTWQFNDIITEGELNRMEDGIEEGIAKAEDAKTNIETHVNDKNNPHNVTPEQIGAETPAGAQAKAEAAAGAVQAELDAHLAENAQLAKYRINANQSIPNDTNTILALTYKDPTLNDDFSELDGNNIRFLKAGVYEVKIAVLWASNATGYRRIEAIVNGEMNTRISQNAVVGTYTTQMFSLFVKANIGTLLNAQVYQNSGGALDIINDTRQCYIMIKKVG